MYILVCRRNWWFLNVLIEHLLILEMYIFENYENCTACEFLKAYNNYSPQRSFRKVMFLHLFVILFTGGVSGKPPRADTPS